MVLQKCTLNILFWRLGCELSVLPSPHTIMLSLKTLIYLFFIKITLHYIKRDCRLYCSVPGCGRAFLPWVCIFSPCLCGFPLGTVIINTCRRTVTILDWVWLHVTINYLFKSWQMSRWIFYGKATWSIFFDLFHVPGITCCYNTYKTTLKGKLSWLC